LPKIFEYLGILIFFYSNEHEPIHVHAKKGENVSKAELIIEDGVIKEIIIKSAKGAEPLQFNDLKNFKIFLNVYADEVVKKWIDYFILHKEVKFEKIQKKLK
jgi:hypothetical protein